MRDSVTVVKVETRETRERALSVVREVYLHEKRWIRDAGTEIPEDIAVRRDQSWFLVSVDGAPAGAIRLVYDPPLELPAEYGVVLEPGIDIDRLKRGNSFVDIGRFMILPRHRRNIRVVLRLLRAAMFEVVERGYTHLLTDVFESDPHSPLKFHTQVLGFERIGTHRIGDLACDSLRILLILDIARSYHRLKSQRNKVFKEVGEGLSSLLEPRLARSA
jgi:hypothetical protein